MNTAVEASRILLDALRAADAPFVHWKSNHHLAEALAGETDLDLLVATRKLPQFRAAMAQAGAVRILSQSWASYPGAEDWLLLDKGTGRFLHLHVHEHLITGLKRVKHLILPWTEFLLAHQRQHVPSGWPIPEAEVELLVLLIRIWAKMPPLRRIWKPRIPRHIVAELRWLENQVNPDTLQRYAGELRLAVPALPPYGDDAAIIATARNLYAQVQQHRRMSWPAALLRAFTEGGTLVLRRFWSKKVGPIRYRKTLAHKGAMVALIGSDGSGKSTQAARLITWLHYKLDAHLLYMGSGDGSTGLANGLRKFLSTTWKKSRRQKPAGSGQSNHNRSFRGKLWRLFDLLLLRRKLRLLRQARAMADSGSIMLLDRYPQNQIPGINDGPRQSDGRGFRWAAQMEQRLLAEAASLGPDLVIKLRVSPAVAQARKPDHVRATIERKCAVVDALEFAGAKTVVIDASLPLEEVTLAAEVSLWDFIAERNRVADSE